MMRCSRRRWLLGAASTLVAERGVCGAATSSTRDIDVGGAPDLARRARLVLPSGAAPQRLLILLHGRGETASESLALRAWTELYGLLDAQRRLSAPPVEALAHPPPVNSERLSRINRQLARRPFGSLAIVCPVTPNPAKFQNRAQMFERYAAWLETSLVPAVRALVPSLDGRVGLDGCSMGGYIGLEVYTRRPHAFTSFGVVQGAIGEWRVPGYVELFAQARERGLESAIHLQTSTRDPFRQATESLSRELDKRGVQNTLEVIPGAHDQPWLRQIGTLEMLLWHDRHL